MMTQPTTISPSIIEALYEDALLLAEEARTVFEFEGRAEEDIGEDACDARVAISCEALRTTTRMMHAIAWLLNQRAHFAGEISESQLRHHGRLPSAQPRPRSRDLALLPRHVADVVEQSVAFYDRVERLDRAWRRSLEVQPAAVHRLRERLGCAFAAHG